MRRGTACQDRRGMDRLRAGSGRSAVSLPRVESSGLEWLKPLSALSASFCTFLRLSALSAIFCVLRLSAVGLRRSVFGASVRSRIGRIQPIPLGTMLFRVGRLYLLRFSFTCNNSGVLFRLFLFQARKIRTECLVFCRSPV